VKDRFFTDLRVIVISSAILSFLFLAGCGYSARSALPAHLRTIHVEPFRNTIEYVTENRDQVYIPLLEVNVRNAVIERFQFNGNLRIANAESADLILKGDLVAFRRVPLRYTDDDKVEEYRLEIAVNFVLLDADQPVPVWMEPGFVGEATYFVRGPNATSESSAIQAAMVDLARRVVERTIENW
jgi:outer membrane lipopolysaccharide assembly protein LptE/RlpB